MKPLFKIVAGLLAAVLPALAAPGPQFGRHAPKSPPHYTAESPLPKGWPEPGPYNQVVRKKYPAYRAAVTTTVSPNGGFWRLFKHIHQQQIPMSAPVEMKLDPSATQGVKMEEMAFLYPSRQVGTTGATAAQVEVRDVPARDALSYAWQGARDDAATARARAALDGALARHHLKPAGYRLLGYNSPFVARSQQTHELQALLR